MMIGKSSDKKQNNILVKSLFFQMGKLKYFMIKVISPLLRYRIKELWLYLTFLIKKKSWRPTKGWYRSRELGYDGSFHWMTYRNCGKGGEWKFA